MFSNPLKQAAEEYLYTNDDSARERAKSQLVRAGSKAVGPLIDALSVTFRKLSSAAWGKRDLTNYVDEVERRGILSGDYLDKLREDIRGMPDSKGPGMSMASSIYSRKACSYAWQVISQIGEDAVRSLFSFVNGRDKRARLTALLALSAEENPSRLVINLVATSKPFHEDFSNDPMEAAAQMLTLRTLGLSGDRRAQEMITQFCAANSVTENEFYDGLIDQAIYLLLESK